MSRLLENRDEAGTALHEFARRWRMHFVTCMQPQYLPEDWSVDHETKGRSTKNFLSEVRNRK